MRKVNRRKMDPSSGQDVWRSYSDMMSGLLLLFVLIMAVCLMQAQRNYTEKLAEQALHELEVTQKEEELAEKEAQLATLQTQLGEQESELEVSQTKASEQEAQLAEQASALEELQAALESQKLSLVEKETELDSLQSQLGEKESELAASQARLGEQESELEASQLRLQEAQTQIDQIIGVKAELIAALNDEFQQNDINVEIDTTTGAIVLDSNVMFDFNEASLTDIGTEILDEALPSYCRVLLSSDYSSYVAEIIIDGYADSSGDYITNLRLSQSRAAAVAEYLYGIMNEFLSAEECDRLMSRLTANGKSSSNLVYDENGNEDADASRRVEIKFRLQDEEMLTQLQELMDLSDVEVTEVDGSGE